jgi:diguanylate cyclase (GGDEF)-like protein
MHRLPGRIALVIAGTALLFVLTTGLSIWWMAGALDRQARTQTATQVGIARANLLARARMITLDYAKWDSAHQAAHRGDVVWLVDNVGSAALIGQVVQLVAVWGGGFDRPMAWQDDGIVEPRATLIEPAILAAAEGRIAHARPGDFDVTEFFAWHDGALFVIGTSHLEAIEHAAAYPEDDRFSGQLLMGIRLDEDAVADIAESLLLTGAGVSAARPGSGPALALPGLDGEPAAWFVWDEPRPGSDMLRRLLPFLTLLTLAAISVAMGGARVMRRGARDLVAAEQRASSAARTDALTGLPNRAAFHEALALPARAGERAILFLDLNGFKGVNDSLGHEAGDRVIAATAARLAAIAGTRSLLARIAGDEFVLLVTGPDARPRIETLAQEVARCFDEPFAVMGHHLHLQAAIGYAIQDEDGRAGADLVRQADLAMYEGKRLKDRAPVAFSTLLEEASQNAFLVERALRTALASRPEEIAVAYQPIVTADGAFHQAEVLARWTARDHGPVPPARFVAVAEKAGLVMDLGRAVLDRVLRDLRDHPALRVSVNISPLQLAAPDFIPDLVADLDRHAIDPRRIEVELTESVLVREPALAARHLEELRAVGFRLALDDFGTGYSSIAYLEQLRFDTLKVDRSFVSGVRASPKRHALLRAMIQMAHGLDLRVVCEGVETAEDLRLLQELGCDLMQGFLFDRAIPIEDLADRWLARGGRAAA